METFNKTFIFLHILLFSSLSFAVNIVPYERMSAEALVRWKNNLPSHVFLASWDLKNARNLCSWRGVVCNMIGSISKIELSNSDLSGTLYSLNFSSLPNLKSLNLQGNNFYGSIPYTVGCLSKLITLDLSGNLGLSGIIPSEIGRLTELQYLNLAECNLSGQIPYQFRNLQKLRYLRIESSNLTFPKWSKFQTFPFLETLIFSCNSFTSKFPNFILACSNLTHLDLRSSSFTGEIPESLLTNLEKLEFLDLIDNDFQGNLQSILTEHRKLKIIALGINNFSGSIPDIFGLIPNTEYIELVSFEGKIPSSLGKLKKLKYLNLEIHSPLNSTIPSELGLCTNLETLILVGNSLTGSLPLSFNNLKNLSTLFIEDTNLSGQILPSLITNWTQLSELSITRNPFVGEIPSEIGLLTNLTDLDLSDNRFSGSIPPMIGSLQNLEMLCLSGNLLSGRIPPTVGNLTDLLLLDISRNYLTGTIPHIVGDFSLRGLDLSNNQLSGKLPKTMSKLTKRLFTLNLRNNHFHGAISKVFTKGCQLGILDLSGNKFNGTFQRTFVNCGKLALLDIGNNEVSGSFPFWMRTLPELHVLKLKYNKFRGTIPLSKVKFSFPKLLVLDISHNEFSGVLPLENFKAMVNASAADFVFADDILRDLSTISLKGMEFDFSSFNRTYTSLDISYNKFQGDIPSSIGRIKDLHTLNLSYNGFTGHIPSLENLTSLESLDLRSNQLVGEIPWQLGKLTFLSFLNLSYNRLVCPIPQQPQLLTFDSSSYIGNPELCGLPLKKMCGKDEPQPKFPVLTTKEDDDFNILDGTTWQVVIFWYGCGMLVGLVVGYFIFKYEKPEWVIGFYYRVYKITDGRILR